MMQISTSLARTKTITEPLADLSNSLMQCKEFYTKYFLVSLFFFYSLFSFTSLAHSTRSAFRDASSKKLTVYNLHSNVRASTLNMFRIAAFVVL